MGYRDPAKNINQSLGAINTALSANQAKFDDVFGTMRDAQNARKAQNAAFLEANKKQQAEGLDNFMDDYWSNVETQEAALKEDPPFTTPVLSPQQVASLSEKLHNLREQVEQEVENEKVNFCPFYSNNFYQRIFESSK